MQRGLLPRQPPAISTLECAGACLQARAVGGDYYDFLDLGDGRLGIVLADISGKGISAALLMANLQAYVRSSYAVARDDPAFLHSLNEYLFDASPSSRYATLFLGRYEEGSRRLRYANCGHNPPLVMRADGTIEWLPPTAPVVGLFDRWSCELGNLVIGPDDTLVLYTDGITDAIDDSGEFFGEERLVEWVSKNRRLAAPALLKTIIDAVTQFTGYGPGRRPDARDREGAVTTTQLDRDELGNLHGPLLLDARARGDARSGTDIAPARESGSRMWSGASAFRKIRSRSRVSPPPWPPVVSGMTGTFCTLAEVLRERRSRSLPALPGLPLVVANLQPAPSRR